MEPGCNEKNLFFTLAQKNLTRLSARHTSFPSEENGMYPTFGCRIVYDNRNIRPLDFLHKII